MSGYNPGCGSATGGITRAIAASPTTCSGESALRAPDTPYGFIGLVAAFETFQFRQGLQSNNVSCLLGRSPGPASLFTLWILFVSNGKFGSSSSVLYVDDIQTRGEDYFFFRTEPLNKEEIDKMTLPRLVVSIETSSGYRYFLNLIILMRLVRIVLHR